MERLEYNKIRKLYYSHHKYSDIAKAIGLDEKIIASIVIEKSLSKKRDRYYLFLVQYAYNNDLQIAHVADMTGVSVSALRRVKRENNIPTKRFNVFNKRINDKIKNEMVDLYLSGVSCKQIAVKFGYKTGKTVEDVLKEKNIKCRDPRRLKNLDYSYFENIDSHDKAYILGLLYTDGYVYKNYEGVCIQLTESDGYLLKTIADKIGSSTSLIHINCESKRIKMPNASDMIRFSVYSKTIAEQVKKFGVVKRKTWDLQIPRDVIPDKFKYSLLRGILDGDGTVGIAKNKNIWLKIATKSERFADSICQLFDGFSKYEFQNGYGNMYSVILKGGNKKTIDILRKIYRHKNDLYLQRKFDKIKQLL